MEKEEPEFFKLDTIDREVLLWTLSHAPKSVQSWIEFIAVDYKKRKAIVINKEKLYIEVKQKSLH